MVACARVSRVAAVLLLALVAGSALVQAANSLVVQTDKGAVQGYNSGNVDKWRGIPYAAPPVGDLRFRVPQEHAPWSGVLSTTSPAPICPQLKNLFPGLWSGDEDCLYANIYAPQGRNLTEKLPVLVWIYGGGWEFGDGIEFGLYDATNLANLHNIIVVTFNYRLGPLGFLAFQAAKNEDPNGAVGTYGVQDQVALLRWVQTNIAAFGGDPDQVTIAGESAGAFSTCIHLVSPLSKGLFRAAIMESGTCSSEIFFQSQASSMAWSNTFATIIGCDPTQPDAQFLDCVRKADLNQIMGPELNYTYTGYFPLMYPSMPWGATIDGMLLPDVPLNLLRQGHNNPVDGVVMGTNLNEGTIFVGRLANVVPALHSPLQPGDLNTLIDHFFNNNGTVRAMVDGTYPQANYPNATVLIEEMLRDFFFLCPSSRALLALSANGVPTYLYQFVFNSGWIEEPSMGVYHSAELEFVFDNAWPPIIHTFSAADQTMADTFGTYWTNTVKYGNPNGASSKDLNGEITWPAYTAATLQNIELDVPSRTNTALLEDRCQMWDRVVQWAPPTMKERVKRAAFIATE